MLIFKCPKCSSDMQETPRQYIIICSHCGYIDDTRAVHFQPKPEPTVKDRIISLLNKQTKKGLEKYGHTLDDCPDNKYDWRLMAMEELIDLAQYQQKEIIRLERLLNP